MIKRTIDRILSEGEGRQLAWLAALALTLFLVLVLIGSFWALGWTDILNLYLDPGGFPLETNGGGGQGSLNIFSLIIAFGGILILNALTVSAFSNVFDNISEKYRNGERRYLMRGHVLILGGSRQLLGILKAMRDNHGFEGKDIVVMTSGDVESLRAGMETALDDKRFASRITWYRGERNNEEDLRSACPDHASCIYIIGEDDESAHDSISIGAADLLNGICTGSGAGIPCYITLEMHSSMDVFQYLPKEEGSRLRTEIVNTSDYTAEQLLVDTPFLPIPGEGQFLHIVIAGNSRTARSFASVAAHICHFPSFARDGRRTIISFIHPGIRSQMDKYVANHQSLFDLSHYAYVSPEGREDFAPKKEYGDFLDIEWEFINGSIASPFVRVELEKWAADPARKLVLAMCSDDSSVNLSAALHLPKSIYKAGVPVAVYQKDHVEVLEKAVGSGMFGCLTCYGEASPDNDALLLRRSLRGKRVNYVYDKQYGNPPAASAEEAWAGLSFAHKLSSIASANSIPLKLRAFGLEPTQASIDALDDDTIEALSEVEHRRWMASVLLMGYSAAPAAERRDRSRFKELKDKEFVHLDIAPYSELAHEADKDMLIVKNIPYIINGR